MEKKNEKDKDNLIRVITPVASWNKPEEHWFTITSINKDLVS